MNAIPIVNAKYLSHTKLLTGPTRRSTMRVSTMISRNAHPTGRFTVPAWLTLLAPAALALLLPMVPSRPTHAEVFSWEDADGGLFVGDVVVLGIGDRVLTGVNWDPNGIPAENDIARFDMGDERYTVDFDEVIVDPPFQAPFTLAPPGELDQIIVGDDEVTFNLRGLEYRLTDPISAPAEIVVGESAGNLISGSDDGMLTVFSGTLVAENVNLGQSYLPIPLGPPLRAQGTLNIQSNAALELDGGIIVGNFGDGELNIAGRVTGGSGLVGWGGTGIGHASVNGPHAQWELGDSLNVGGEGVGALEVKGGGSVQTPHQVVLGRRATGIGMATIGTGNVVGGNLAELIADEVIVGREGVGTLHIVNDGAVTSSEASIAQMPDSSGTVSVDGVGSWSGGAPLSALVVGGQGDGSLDVTEEGNVQFVDVTAGDQQGSTGQITVSGTDAHLRASRWFYVGNRGDGTLDINNGGTIEVSFVAYVADSPGRSSVTVDGAGSEWLVGDELRLGGSGSASMSISGGGTVSVDGASEIAAQLNQPGSGSALITGDGSAWNTSGWIVVGGGGGAGSRFGRMNVEYAGQVENIDGAIAASVSSTGEVTVTGDHSLWTNTGSLGIGGTADASGGTGSLTIADHGRVVVEETLVIWEDGTVRVEEGDLDANEIDNSNGGVFDLAGGRLAANVIQGSLDNQGGTFAPGRSIAVASVGGDYTQSNHASLEIELAGIDNSDPQMPEYDALQVEGTAALGGTLEALLADADGEAFQPEGGEQFEILSAGTGVSGRFAEILLPTLGGELTWDVVYSADAVSLEVSGGVIPGDYDGDDDVDGQDFLAWQRGESPDPLSAADLADWENNYSTTGGALRAVSAQIPEPTALCLLVLALGTTRLGSHLYRPPH